MARADQFRPAYLQIEQLGNGDYALLWKLPAIDGRTISDAHPVLPVGSQPLTEVHVVNGLHPDLPFDYYLELLRGFKRIRPDIHLKCFTAVEIAFFADLYRMTDEQVLRELKAAGLDSLPGGGAEIFAPRVRKKICNDKCDADRYLSIHRLAHGMGMRSNVTMLYGHIETIEERVDHIGLDLLRADIGPAMGVTARDDKIELPIAWTDYWGKEHKTVTGNPVAFHAMRGLAAHSNGFHTVRTLAVLMSLLGD